MMPLVVLGLIVLIAVLFLIYKLAYAPAYGALEKMGVKGPVPRAVWGNVTEFVKDRNGMMKSLQQKYGDVSGFYIGAMPTLVIADPELIKLIMVKNFDSFTDHVEFLAVDIFKPCGMPPLLFSETGELWRHSRHAITPTFTANRMKKMVPIVQQHVHTFLKHLEITHDKGENVEVWRTFGAFTMESMLGVTFGMEMNMHIHDGKENPLISCARDFFDLQSANSGTVDPFTILALKSHLPFLEKLAAYFIPKALLKSFQYLVNTAGALVESRRQEQGAIKHDDFLQLMLELETGDANDKEMKSKGIIFTHGEMISHCLTFLLAGYETTANCLAFTSYLLAMNPEVQDKLCHEIDSYIEHHPASTSALEASQELEYLDMVIQESLRLYPPVYITGRMCTQDTQIAGFDIPRGTSVLLPIFNIHHDKAIWEDPETFKPERFTSEEKEKRPQLCHLPFGFGPRNCIGMRFALMEAKMVLISILKKYKFMCGPKTEVPLQLEIGNIITMSPKNGIYLKIEQRN